MSTEELIEYLEQGIKDSEIVPGEWNLVEVPVDSIEEILRHIRNNALMRASLEVISTDESMYESRGGEWHRDTSRAAKMATRALEETK